MILALALLISTGIGYLLAGVLLPQYKPAWTDWILKVSVGFGLGLGITSCLFFVERELIGPSIPVSILVELLLLLSAGFIFWSRRATRPQVTASHAQPQGVMWWLLPAFLLALALSISLFVDSTMANPYGAWDAWAIWNQRAKLFAQPDASWRRAFSPLLNEVAGAGATHADYPMLLSGYIARCWSWTGSIGDVAAPIAVAALFSAATLGLLISALAILRSWSLAILAPLILLACAFLQNGPWQYADVPLGYYYLCAFALLLLADSPSTFILAGLAVGLAAWTKNEGMLFALATGLALAAYGVKTKNWKALAAFAAGALGPMAVVLSFRWGIAPPTGTYAGVSTGDIAHKVIEGSRYVTIIQSLWRDTVSQGAGLANPVILVGLLLAFLKLAPGRWRQPMTMAALGALVLVCAGYVSIYVITPLDLTWHLNTSLNRLYMHLWPSFVFLALGICRSAEETAQVVQEPTPAARPLGRTKSRATRAARK